MKCSNSKISPLISPNNISSPWIIFFATTLGAIMVNIDANIVNVALPIIAKGYATKMGKVQWIISSYILTVCVLLPISGRLSDIYTKRFIYLLGFAIFTVGSALCSIANSLTMLIAFRVLQGVGAAMIMSNNQAFIVMNFPRDMQGRALSINSMSASFGAIAGPALGGFLLSILSWRSIFYINIPIGIVGCFVGYYVLPHNEERMKHTLDIIGSILFAAVITSVLLILNNISDGDFLVKQNLILLLTGCVTAWFFIRRQRQISNPALDLSLFKKPLYLHSNIAAFVVFMVLGGNSILLPFYLHDMLKLTPGLIGIMMFIGPCIMLFLAPVSGYLTDKYSTRIFVIIGLVLLILGLFLQGSMTEHGALRNVVICQLIIGCGFAFFQPPNNVTLFKNINSVNFGVASSINALVRNVGRVFGVVVATSIFSLLFEHVLKSYHMQLHNAAFLFGFKIAFYSLGFCVLVALYNSIKINRVETPT